jgi:flagellin-like hook-associated protein FlgL
MTSVGNVATLAQNLLLQSQVRTIQTQLDKTQLQIASGKKTDIYSGLGSTSRLTLDFHRQKEQIQNYRDNIAATSARLQVMDKALTRLTEIGTEFRSKFLQNRIYMGTDPSVRAVFQQEAQSALREINQILNSQYEGRYLFSGRLISTPPMINPGAVGSAGTPLAVLDNVVNTAAGSNYVTNGAQTCLNSVVTTLTPSGAAYTGVAPNTYPYQGDLPAYSNVSPFTNALTIRADSGTDIGYTVRGDDTSVAALLQGVYIFATATYNAGAEQSFFSLMDAASFRIDQSLDGSTLTAPTGVPTSTNPAFSGLRALLGNVGAIENRLKSVDLQHEQTQTLLDNELSRLEDADPYEAITKLQGLQSQLTSSFQVTATLRDLTLSKLI